MTIYPNLSALESFSIIQEISANNLANLNTNEFKASRVDLQTGPLEQGVQVAQIIQDQSEGALIPELTLTTNEQGQVEQELAYIQSSNTDLVQEMITQISTEQAFAANVKAIETYNSMTGSILDLFI